MPGLEMSRKRSGGLVQVALASEKAMAFNGRNSNNNTVHWRWLFDKQKANMDFPICCANSRCITSELIKVDLG